MAALRLLWDILTINSTQHSRTPITSNSEPNSFWWHNIERIDTFWKHFWAFQRFARFSHPRHLSHALRKGSSDSFQGSTTTTTAITTRFTSKSKLQRELLCVFWRRFENEQQQTIQKDKPTYKKSNHCTEAAIPKLINSKSIRALIRSNSNAWTCSIHLYTMVWGSAEISIGFKGSTSFWNRFCSFPTTHILSSNTFLILIRIHNVPII